MTTAPFSNHRPRTLQVPHASARPAALFVTPYIPRAPLPLERLICLPTSSLAALRVTSTHPSLLQTLASQRSGLRCIRQGKPDSVTIDATAYLYSFVCFNVTCFQYDIMNMAVYCMP